MQHSVVEGCRRLDAHLAWWYPGRPNGAIKAVCRRGNGDHVDHVGVVRGPGKPAGGGDGYAVEILPPQPPLIARDLGTGKPTGEVVRHRGDRVVDLP
eukprot:2554331-Prymnesium_polylepis.1